MFEALLSNRTVSVLVEALPRILTAGLTMTIPLTLLSFFFAMIIAVAVALVQYANVPVLRQIARFYIWVIRGTPLLVQLFIIFYGLPSVGIMLNAFPAAVIAFAFNEGAYCAETMRGALESVPQGQLEAGYCVGMSWWQIMRRIVLPQALRTAVPALSNSLIGMIKDTSLASNITVAELFMAGQRVAARTYIFLPIYCEVAVVYLLFCTVITKLQALLERARVSTGKAGNKFYNGHAWSFRACPFFDIGRISFESDELFTGQASDHRAQGRDRPPQREGHDARGRKQDRPLSAGRLRAGFPGGRLYGFQRYRHRYFRHPAYAGDRREGVAPGRSGAADEGAAGLRDRQNRTN